MKGANLMVLCGDEMCRLLTKAINTERHPDHPIEVVDVVWQGAAYTFKVVVRDPEPKGDAK